MTDRRARLAPMGRLLSAIAPTLVLTLLVLAVFGRLVAEPAGLLVDGQHPSVDEYVLPGDESPGNDLTRLFLPLHLRIGRWVRATGRVPGWDPAGFGGRPLVGNPQASLWYPPVWLAWWSGTPSALGWVTVAHLVFGAVGAYRLGRDVGLDRTAAVITGGVFALSPYVLAQVAEGHLPHVWAACFYPWAFLAQRLWRRGDWRGAVLLPPVLAAPILAGHYQEAYYLLLVLFGWGLFDALRGCWERLRSRATSSLPPCRGGPGWGGGRSPSRPAAPHPNPPPQGGRGPEKTSDLPQHTLRLSKPRRRGDDTPSPLAGEGRGGGAGGNASPAAPPPTLTLPHKGGGNRRGRVGALARLAAWFGLVGLAITIAAVEWLPGLAHRPWLLAAPRPSMGEAGKYHWHPANLLQLLDPSALGGPADYFGRVSYWESLVSFGWVPLVLAVVAVAGSSRRGEVRGWTVLAIVSIVFAAGPWLGLFRVLYHAVPGMNQFRAPGRALFLASLAVAVLAGLGIEALRTGGTRRIEAVAMRYWRAAVVMAGIVVLGAIGSQGIDRVTPGKLARLSESDRWLLGCDRLAQSAGFWMALAAVGLALEWGRRDGDRAARLIGVLALVDVAAHGVAGVVVSPASRWIGPDPIAASIRKEAPRGPFRIRAREAFFNDLRIVAAGLETTNLQDQFQLRHAADVYEPLYGLPGPPTRRERRFPGSRPRMNALRVAVLERMNVAFVVMDRALEPLRWPRVAVGDGEARTWLYRNPTPLPRAYVVPRSERHADEPSTVARFPTIDPRAAVLMPADPLGPPQGSRQPFTPARYENIQPDRIVVRVETEAPGLLVTCDAWMPGWSATLDGVAVPIWRGDRAWRVVALPRAGRHEVVMTYRAPGLVLGGAITGVGVVGWLAIAAGGMASRVGRGGSLSQKSALHS